mgnify:CR=1 FL=1
MNDQKLSREAKLLLLSILKEGFYTDEQREKIAEAFGLYTIMISDEALKELIDKL